MDESIFEQPQSEVQPKNKLKRAIQFLSILLLIAVIPLTVLFAERQQQTQQNADFAGGLNVSVNPSAINQGHTAVVNLSGGCACGINIGIDSQGGLTCGQPVNTFNDCLHGPPGTTFTWQWTCTATGQGGNYGITGTGGNGSCNTSNQYTIIAPAPTPTPIPPTATPIPTPTPTPAPLATTLGFSLTLTGIGNGGANQNPIHKTRNATVCLYPLTIDPTGDPNCSKIPTNLKVAGTVTYDSSSGTFTSASFNAGTTVTSGQYIVLVKADNFLRKRLGTVQTINAGVNNPLGTVLLLPGDVDNSNITDINDYNDLMSCYAAKFTGASCLFKPTGNITGADLNDDGKVDGVDYNLYIRSLAVQAGD